MVTMKLKAPAMDPTPRMSRPSTQKSTPLVVAYWEAVSGA